MSERKSWDVVPKRRAQPAPVREPAAPARPRPRVAEQPARAARVQERPAARTKPAAPVRGSVRSQPLGSLSDRRRKRRKATRTITLGAFALLIAGLWYAAWLPAVRIQHIEAAGPGSDAARQIANAQISGTYFHLLPRNSIFVYPQARVRAAILASVPEASAVSLSRTSFSSLSVQTSPRAEAFVWCGTNIATPLPSGACYSADMNGFVFKLSEGTVVPVSAPVQSASSSPVASSTALVLAKNTPRAKDVQAATPHELGQVRVFAPLDRSVADGSSPVGAHVVAPGRIPDAIKFVDAMRELGAPVSSLALRDDEADLWMNNENTRITYVLGHEKEAVELAASALPSLPLGDGSIQYVDLRFPGKAYIKRYGE